MPPFNRSSMTFTTAKSVVAQAAGAQGDAEMLTLAGRALDTVGQKWNRIRWNWLLSEAPNVSVFAPFTITGCSVAADLVTVTSTSSLSSVRADDLVILNGIFDGETAVSATGATSFTLVSSALASATGLNISFQRAVYALPSDFKTMYTVRLLTNPRPLYYIQRRLYDRLVTYQNVGTIPGCYDLFLMNPGGKIRLIPPPSQTDQLKLRYFRRMTLPSLVASASGLDIPQDAEDVFLAGAKHYFLVDKEGPGSERAAFWKAYSDDGIKELLNDTNVVPDENLTFMPNYAQGWAGYGNPNSTIPWDDMF